MTDLFAAMVNAFAVPLLVAHKHQNQIVLFHVLEITLNRAVEMILSLFTKIPHSQPSIIPPFLITHQWDVILILGLMVALLHGDKIKSPTPS